MLSNLIPNFLLKPMIDTASSTVLAEYDQQTRERAERFAKAWKAYCGDLPDTLRVKQGDYDDNITLSFPRVVVDKGVASLFGEEVEFKVKNGYGESGEDGEPVPTPAQDALNKCWEQNRLMSSLTNFGINGGVFGHTFVKIHRDKAKKYPRLINLNPQDMAVIWNSGDIEKVEEFRQQWTGIRFDSTGKRVVVVYRQRTVNHETYWEIIDSESVNSHKFVETGTERWEYPFPPIFHNQNLPRTNEFWGMSDLEEDVLGMGDGLNFNASNTNRIIRFHAHPKTIGKGFDGDSLTMSIDSVTCLPSPESDLFNLEMASDLSASLEFYKILKRAYQEVTRIPAVSVGEVENIGDLSGVALKILYSPLLEKTATKRRLYGEMLQEVNTALLVLMGFEAESKETIEIVWGNALPADEKGNAEVLQLHEALGVSKETIIGKLGYNAGQEMAKSSKEADDVMEREQKANESSVMGAFNRGK